MSAVLFALLCAAAYGISDFVGGVVSRRSAAWPVAFVVQSASAVTLLLVAPWVASSAGLHDLAWGAAAGVGSGVGVSFLFRGFAAGRMSVVAPLSGVGAAVLPVLAGLVLGERFGLVVLLGLVAALPGIWLVSADEDAPGEPHDEAGAPPSPVDTGVMDGLLAGIGFAGTFIGLGQVSDGAGLWPLVATQASSTITVAVLAALLGVRVLPLARGAIHAWYAGPFGALAGLSFYLATSQGGLLSVAAVLASLYPAVTILLAVLLLRERIGRGQVIGLALCGLCVALVSAG